MTWINYNQLYYFYVIASELSIARAAEKMRLTPANLSIQLKQLEEALNTQLFDRTKKGLSLTRNGALALRHAKTMFNSSDALVKEIAETTSQNRDIMKIGSISGISKSVQFELIQHFFECDSTRIEFHEESADSLLEKLSKNEIDVVLTNHPLSHPSAVIQNVPLADYEIFAVAAPNYAKIASTSQNGRTPVFIAKNCAYREHVNHWIENNSHSYAIKGEIDDVVLLRITASSGKGVALLPSIVVRHELLNQTLQIMDHIPNAREYFFLSVNASTTLHPLISSVVEKFSTPQPNIFSSNH